jgi:superfamily II DNA or RNA helicase
MKYVPKAQRKAWHEKAIEAAIGADLHSVMGPLLETKELDRLAELVRQTKDDDLEDLSHYATEPAAKKLEKGHLDLAARLWRAQGLRIVNAKTSQYYDTALSNFERAKRCFERAARCRPLSNDRVITLRASRLCDMVPGEIALVNPGKQFVRRGDARRPRGAGPFRTFLPKPAAAKVKTSPELPAAYDLPWSGWNRIAAENPAKMDRLRHLLEQHEEGRVLIIREYIAKEIGAPLVTGKTPQAERERVYDRFRRGELSCIVLSKVGNFAIDLPMWTSGLTP